MFSTKETRECIAYEPGDCLSYIFKECKGLHSLIKLTCTREIEGKEPTTEVRYYMSSLHKDPKLMAEDIRFHWEIGNNLHWQLNVSFREDA
ncbi:ISAs1 family transposase [Bacteroides bouchesdurhonensis]